MSLPQYLRKLTQQKPFFAALAVAAHALGCGGGYAKRRGAC
jgi:hypothetical protein